MLKEGHPWVDRVIQDLHLPGRTLIVMVRRAGKILVPDGTFRFQAGDMVVMHTNKTYRNMKHIEV